MARIRLGISSCLLGERVRYDGGHKRDRHITSLFVSHVEWVPVCPEAESGLGVPREAMLLEGDPGAPRLVGRESGRDYTETVTGWARRRLPQLAAAGLRGFIFKSRSPSSGPADIPVRPAGDGPGGQGKGIFARMVMESLPGLPVTDEERLARPAAGESFIESVFVYDCWLGSVAGRESARALARFHRQHRHVVMARSVSHLRRLDELLARAGNRRVADLQRCYLEILAEAMAVEADRDSHARALADIAGGLVERATPAERHGLEAAIARFRRGSVPPSLPRLLVRRLAFRHEPSMLRWHYLQPPLAEARLRRRHRSVYENIT